MKSLIQTSEQVRAFLAGRRTRFCVPVKPQPEFGIDLCPWVKSGWAETTASGACTCVPVSCPFTPGERLFVKETWWDYGRFLHTTTYPEDADSPSDWKWQSTEIASMVRYVDCDQGDMIVRGINTHRKRSTIHMPKWAARIFLTIKDCKVMQVQETSEEEAIAEGYDGVRWVFAFTVEVDIKQ